MRINFPSGFRLFSGDATLEDFKIADEGKTPCRLIELFGKVCAEIKGKTGK